MIKTVHSEAGTAELTLEFHVKCALAADRLNLLSTYCLPCWLLGSVSFPMSLFGGKLKPGTLRATGHSYRASWHWWLSDLSEVMLFCKCPQYQVDRSSFSSKRIACCRYTGSTSTVYFGTVSGISQSVSNQVKRDHTFVFLRFSWISAWILVLFYIRHMKQTFYGQKNYT